MFCFIFYLIEYFHDISVSYPSSCKFFSSVLIALLRTFASSLSDSHLVISRFPRFFFCFLFFLNNFLGAFFKWVSRETKSFFASVLRSWISLEHTPVWFCPSASSSSVSVGFFWKFCGVFFLLCVGFFLSPGRHRILCRNPSFGARLMEWQLLE